MDNLRIPLCYFNETASVILNFMGGSVDTVKIRSILSEYKYCGSHKFMYIPVFCTPTRWNLVF